MYVSPQMWVGRGPEGAQHPRTVTEAAALVRDGEVVVLPSTDMAEDVLLNLGADPEWVRYALGRVLPDAVSF